METTIQKLSPKMVDDFLYFFDEIAFEDNPEWKGCYCQFFYFDSNEEWGKRTINQNREDSRRHITANHMNGYIAYIDGNPVGWCHVDDITKLARLNNLYNEFSNEGEVAAIVCFIIAPKFRRRGIARQLLQRVCMDLKANGYTFAEAYPKRNARTEAENYHGPIEMYLNNDFKTVEERELFTIVKKAL